MTADLDKNSHRHLSSLDELENIRVTGVKTFHACPRRWKAEILGEGVHRESPYARRGTAVHAIVERYLRGEPATDAFFEEARIFLNSQELPEEEIEACFRYLGTLEPLRDRVLHVEHTVSHSGYWHPIVGHVDAIFWYNDEGDILILDHKTNRFYRGSDWWSRQPQQRLYAWLVRRTFLGREPPLRDIYFAIGYVNLDRRVIWRTDPADAAWAWQQYDNLMLELEVYRRTEEWPERVNPDCRFCPLKSTCQTLQRHTEGGSDGTMLERYQWAGTQAKVFEAILEDLREQILTRVDQSGEVTEGNLRAWAKRTQRRSISFADAWDAVAPRCGMPALPTIYSEWEPLAKVFKPQMVELNKLAKRLAGPLSGNSLLEQTLAEKCETTESLSLIVEETTNGDK